MPLHDGHKGTRHFSLGVVVGGYSYQPQRMGVHNRRVVWLYKHLPRSILLPDVDEAISGHGPSVTPIYVDNAIELTLLAIEKYLTEQEARTAQRHRLSRHHKSRTMIVTKSRLAAIRSKQAWLPTHSAGC